MSTINMSILGTSILFARGTNIHNQLTLIMNSDHGNEYFKILKLKLDIIYQSDNTKDNRDRLQDFILKHGEEIYLKYSELGDNDLSYDLK